MKFRLCVLAAITAAVALAQTAEITGIVTDPSGVAVPGAEITASNIDTGVPKTATTNEQGHFTLPFLNPGNYNVTVKKSGFKTLSRSGVPLEVAQIARLDFRLEVGEIRETVTVVAEAPLLASESATIGEVITSKKMVDLPLNGRDFTSLATLVPGTVSRGTDSSLQSSKVSINGGRNSKTVYMIDGGNVASQYFDGASIVPSVDAIQEFSVQSNAMSAEYGQGASVLNISLRSGTNQLHGSAYEFLRNQVLDARNFFNSSTTRPAVKQNMFGFTLGGPITLPRIYRGKDRTFFFVAYEGTRVRRASTYNTLVPSAAMRGGNFSELKTALLDPATTKVDRSVPAGYVRQPFPGNQIPAQRFAPQSTFFLPMYPVANTPTGMYLFTPSRSNTADSANIRIDHRLSGNDALMGSYTLQTVSDYAPGRFPANGGVSLDLRKQRISITQTHTFTPTTINELRLGYVRDAFLRSQQGLGTNYTVQAGIGGFEEQSADFPGFPGLNISSYLGFNFNGWVPINFRDNKFEIINAVTRIQGAHTIKAGFDLRRYDTNTTNAAYSRGNFYFTGTYAGNSFADFLLGLPYQGQRSFPRNAFGIHFVSNQHFFVQDDWKITPRLTLNLGLRYERNPPPGVMNDQIASTDPVSQRIVVASDSQGRINYDGQQVGKYLYPLVADVVVPSSKAGLNHTLKNTDLNNFAPRFGLAWRPFSDTLVFRAGYGVFYGLIQGNRLESTGIVNPPFLADEQGNYNTRPAPTRTLANMFAPASQGLVLAPLSFFQLDPDARDPYFQQWNLTVQKVLRGVLSLEGAYVGSKSTKLEFSRPINVPPPGPGTIQTRRMWPRFSTGWLVENSAGSTYNALQGKAQIKSWRGMSFLASYCYSKSLDNLSADAQSNSSVDPSNNRNNKGPSDFDLRHRFVFSGNYALPFGRNGKSVVARLAKGWEAGTIVTIQGGLPFSPGMSTDRANTGIVLRPDRIGSGHLDNRTLQRDFDVSAFLLPEMYTYGNAGRNILYARGRSNWDFVMMRNFRLRERTTLQFRGEFFNFTNTPAFGGPVTNIQASNAGRITSAGEPRDVQLALKLLF